VSDCDVGAFCLGGSLAKGSSFFSVFFSVLTEGGISAANSLSILFDI